MISDTEYTDSEYARAVAEFVSRKGVTRCPTVCLAATGASVSDADRVALRSHAEVRDAVRRARRRDVRQMISPREGIADGGIPGQIGVNREAAD